MDVMTPEQRSRCMSRIKGKHTKPELALRQALWAAGLRYRLHGRLPGRPDIVFPRSRVAVFLDGCFWHGCPKHAVKPKTNSFFWAKKLAGNADRDKRINAALADMGWRAVRVWEHDVKESLPRIVTRISRLVKKGSTA
jgi:DNA mismatch endonuclease (patch repair protein)